MYYETKDQNIYNLPLELIFKIVMDYDLSLSDIIHLCRSSIYLYYQLYQNNLFLAFFISSKYLISSFRD